MHRLTHQPQIIVEEDEDEEEDENDDVATPLRPMDTFPYARRTSHTITPPLTPITEATSPTPSATSTISKHEFLNFRLDRGVLTDMVMIGAISDRGEFCKARKYLYTPTMANYTVTEWKVDEKNGAMVCEQLDTICQLRHRRLARTYGYHYDSNRLLIFRTHVPTGTIADKLRQSALGEEHALRYISQVIDALGYLHERRIVHGKLNASNLLVTLSNDILLADQFLDGLPLVQKRRALLCSPPEAFTNPDRFPCHTIAADVWAIGCVLVAMLTRHPPFSAHFLHFDGEQLHEELTRAWKAKTLKYSSATLTPSATHPLTTLIDTIFTELPTNRPTCQTLLEHLGPKTSSRSIHPAATTTTHQSTKTIDRQLEELIEIHEKSKDTTNHGVRAFLRWYLSRATIFTIMMVKWVAMVLCAAMSLAMVAGSVILSIYIIYNAIEMVCQCRLNEGHMILNISGFIVLIALILLPIIILLITLCCNNSLEKYHNDVECGKVERSRYVMKRPVRDVIICGYIVVEGSGEGVEENNRKTGIAEGMAQLINRGDFLSGVAKIA